MCGSKYRNRATPFVEFGPNLVFCVLSYWLSTLNTKASGLRFNSRLYYYGERVVRKIMPKSRVQGRNYVFTLNNPGDHPGSKNRIKQLLRDVLHRTKCRIRYITYSVERGAEGTRHYQGYAQFTRQVSRSWVKRTFGSDTWFEVAKGNLKSNQEYTRKRAGHEKGPFEAGEAKKSTKRDFRKVVSHLKEGGTLDDVMDENPACYVRNKDMLQDYANEVKGHRDWQMKVRIYVGLSGTGKSSTARLKYPNAYYMGHPTGGRMWMPGYVAQDVIVYNEFRSCNIKLRDMLKFLDSDPMLLEAKGRNMNMVSNTLVITTNEDPKDWYPKVKASARRLLERRLQEPKVKIYDFQEGHEYPDFVKVKRTESFHLSSFTFEVSSQDDYSRPYAQTIQTEGNDMGYGQSGHTSGSGSIRYEGSMHPHQ